MADSSAPRPTRHDIAGDRIPVLLYHSVSDSPHPAIAEFSTGIDEFAEHVRAIAESGREAVTFGELAARLAARDHARLSGLVCVTFDDGWADNLAAARLLSETGLPATFFVTSGFVDSAAMLTTDELRELAALPGIEIGAHSVSHPYLDELDDRALTREVRECRQWLRGALGFEIDSFAYPHGAHGARVRQAVIDAGFKSAAAVKNAISHPRDDIYAVARWTVLEQHDAGEVRELLAGTSGQPAWSGEKLRTKAYRAFRRARRSIRGVDGGLAGDEDYRSHEERANGHKFLDDKSDAVSGESIEDTASAGDGGDG